MEKSKMFWDSKVWNFNIINFLTKQVPKFETVTRETVETYRGNRPERVTTSEKRDVFQNLPEEFQSVLLREQNGTSTGPSRVIENDTEKCKPKPLWIEVY